MCCCVKLGFITLLGLLKMKWNKFIRGSGGRRQWSIVYDWKRKCNEQIERTSCEETPTIGGRKLCKYIGNELLSGNWSLI